MVSGFDCGFYKSIKDGVKTCTTRVEDKGLCVDDVVVLSFSPDDCGDVHDLVARIVNVSVYQFRFLDAIVAFKEGFRDVGLLRWCLKCFYPNIEEGDLCFVYEFELL